jgi:hypothetical protein
VGYGGAEPLAPVLLAVAPAQRQSRVTVLLRLILAIPHFVVVYVLNIAAWLILVISWFAALFTGRLPAWAAEFLTGYLGWQTRVYGYVLLLTDVYPPFALADADYPVRVAVRPGRLNRLAVLFRIFLMIPAGIVAGLLSYGAFTIMGFVTWLIVLITGRMPDALHQSVSAVLRYQTRLYGYEFMLTSTYPEGVFGDAEAGTDPPPPWGMVLSSGAKQLVGTYLVLGVLVIGAFIGVGAVVGTSGSAVNSAVAANQVQADFAPVNDALTAYASKAQACNQQLSCLTALDRALATNLSTVGSQLRSVSMPAGASSAASSLEFAATKASQTFSALAAATTATDYNNGVPGMQQALNVLITTYNNLGSALTTA